MQITKISIKRSTIVVVLFTILTLLGIFSYTQMSYELLPKFSPNVVTVSTVYPGAAPSEVENSVTRKLEDALASLEGIDVMKSTSLESFSIITIELDDDVDVDLILQDAQRDIDAVLGDLPEDVDPPSLGKFSLDDMPIMQMGAYSNLTATDFYDLMDQRIQPMISQIDGVAQVNLLGGAEREIKVNLDQNKLNTYGISPLQVNQAIAQANLDFPTGKLKSDKEQILIRLAGKFTQVDEIGELIVSYADGSPIKIKDVAEVVDSNKDEEILSRLNGNSAIGISIQKQSDANAVDVAERVNKALAQLETTYAGDDLRFEISQDSSEFTLEAANAVIHDLIIAVVLVAVIMLLFLHSFRNAVIVMIAVPMSIIATFTVMYLAGFTLNLMSLLALSLVVGILVDDAIVVIENIYRHMEKGKSAIQASYDGIREIGGTVTSITLVIVVVFVPLSMTGGLISGILTQFSITVAVATMMSLLVAFTLIPLLTSRFSKLEHLDPKSIFGKIVNGFEGFLDAFVAWLTGILKWSFNHKIITLVATFVLFVSSFMLVGYGFIGSEFVSQGDKGEFIMRLELPKSATLEETNFTTREAENFLTKNPMVTSVFTTVGQTTGSMSGSQSTPYASEITVKMVDGKKRNLTAPEFAREMEIALEENIVGAEFTAVPIGITGTANDAPIQIVLSGPDLDTLKSFSQRVLAEVEKVPGTRKAQTSLEDGNPEIRVEVDRAKMSDLGLDMAMVGGTMQVAFNGNTDTKYRDGDYEYDINIRMDEFDRKSVADIENLAFVNTKGQTVLLKQFAKAIPSEGPSELNRQDRITSVTVQSQVSGRPSGTVGTEIQERIAKLDLPKEVTVAYEGDMKMQEEGFGSLGVALLASILLIYLIMVALYDNYVFPLVVMFSLPLAVIGALLALAMSGSALSIFSILGLIMLMGLVAKNAILLVDFTNQLKAAGLEVKAALVKAVEIRFRPILMTTLAMVFGMLPIALASGAGAEWKNGLAWALIGGLISSMFLTMVVVPVIYYIFDRILARFGKDKKEEIIIEETELSESESEVAEYV
ncbi:efflux RND transporter permease subunit [Echinicola vietnamensis]|uniref:Cation/multidrug efflux pump n=1 Tax=Echinicola vietnamensis (strain DSM 17526 / LMG 23754 / KMM 6221) TaxID=926556 RepID=L0FYH6_ECHVK|nr:efflux RND transporter permease subunit [Echinicola vietnamensis]AGA77816.1 cation/multidrug efflux pump [Echinicola vietnamensis DSM 17526]